MPVTETIARRRNRDWSVFIKSVVLLVYNIPIYEAYSFFKTLGAKKTLRWTPGANKTKVIPDRNEIS
jgi:hypothetical protein